jgi:hypothetical protein
MLKQFHKWKVQVARILSVHVRVKNNWKVIIYFQLTDYKGVIDVICVMIDLYF